MGSQQNTHTHTPHFVLTLFLLLLLLLWRGRLQDSLDLIREKPRQGNLIRYFGSEEAEEIAQEELERKRNAPFNFNADTGAGKYQTSQISYSSIQKLDNGLASVFKYSYDNLSIIACTLEIINEECPEDHDEARWRNMVAVAKGICTGGSAYEKKYTSFAGESVQTQIRRHFLTDVGLGLGILTSYTRALKAQRYLDLFADVETISRADTALEALLEILNYDFRYLSDLLVNFRTTMMSPDDPKTMAEAAERASKICSAVSQSDSIEKIFKDLRSAILLAGRAGADMADALLDSLNLEKKKSGFMQVFVEMDADDDGYLSKEDFKSLVPKLNGMLLSTHAIEPSEISETFDGRISISDCVDFIFQKQTQNSPLFPSDLDMEMTNFSLYSGKFGGDNELSSFMDKVQEYDTVRVSSNKMAPCVMNVDYLSVEGETRRTLKTGLCSMQKIKLQEGHPVKNFQMTPAYLFLGRLNPGETATGRMTLQNIGPEAARFNVGTVPAPFELKYTPGLLAAGMTRSIDITVTIPEDHGDRECYACEVVIKTELNFLYCICVAKLNKAMVTMD